MNNHFNSCRFQNRNEFRAVEGSWGGRYGEMILSSSCPLIEWHTPASLGTRPFTITAGTKLDFIQDLMHSDRWNRCEISNDNYIQVRENIAQISTLKIFFKNTERSFVRNDFTFSIKCILMKQTLHPELFLFIFFISWSDYPF